MDSKYILSALSFLLLSCREKNDFVINGSPIYVLIVITMLIIIIIIIITIMIIITIITIIIITIIIMLIIIVKGKNVPTSLVPTLAPPC